MALSWTQVQNGLPFMTGRVNKGTRGDATFTLHRNGRQGWVVKMYKGKTFVYGPVVYTAAKDKYNKLLTGNES